MKSLINTCGLVLLLCISASAQSIPTSPADAVRLAAKAEDCGCESQPVPEVLAIVNGIKITNAELAANPRIKQLQREVIETRKQEVELQINSLLLEAEARRLGTNTTALLQTEIIGKVKAPTEAEAQAFYDQNKAKINAEFASVQSEILSYLKGEREREAAKAYAQRLRAAAKITVSPLPVTAPASKQDLARVFATVNGKNITSGDVEESLKPLIFSVQEQTFSLRKQEVDQRINDVLLEHEASKRGITTKALVEAEIGSKTGGVTDIDAEQFYQKNKERLNGNFPTLKTQIIQYLVEQRKREQEQALAERLRSGAKLQLFLIEPQPPLYTIAIDDQPLRGNPAATTTVVVFTDLQCPACAELHPIVERLIGVYGERIKFVIRDYPLNQHKEAMMAAVAAEAAREQGKYWEYVAILFQNQSALQVDKLKEYATRLKLEQAKFDQALLSDRLKEKVQRDQMDGSKIGVNGTPAIFINGRRFADRSYEGLHAALNASLTNKR
ncbi:MAG: DsbA family protein [Pyrinomonadaceae bacterium]